MIDDALRSIYRARGLAYKHVPGRHQQKRHGGAAAAGAPQPAAAGGPAGSSEPAAAPRNPARPVRRVDDYRKSAEERKRNIQEIKQVSAQVTHAGRLIDKLSGRKNPDWGVIGSAAHLHDLVSNYASRLGLNPAAGPKPAGRSDPNTPASRSARVQAYAAAVKKNLAAIVQHLKSDGAHYRGFDDLRDLAKDMQEDTADWGL